LKSQGYWASYNIPYFKDIFEASGSPGMVKKYGDFYSYENGARSKIFARDQSKVEDLDSMMKLMRYNDFQNDPLSRCNCTPPYSAENAISSRNDLNPSNGTYPIKLLGHRSSGSTDMKMTNLDLFLLQQFVSWSGPAFDPLPPFQWSQTDFKDIPHYGHPDRFEFEPLIHQWKWLWMEILPMNLWRHPPISNISFWSQKHFTLKITFYLSRGSGILLILLKIRFVLKFK